ncbi:MAG: serine hydrolase domain-containing protein [Acidobacteriota bacterium]|nr:serine hydrolase domain-containing protein [Acidobacteriota bacterium]
MDNNKKLFIVFIFCLSAVLVFGFTAQKAIAFQAYTHSALTEKVDAMFKQWDSTDSPGAALGIFKAGRIIYARGYGIANLEYTLPWSSQNPSRIGSISKQFIAMCIAILAEQGKLSLDDNIRKFLPDWPEYNGPITIKHLLYHTSGVREYLTLVELMGKPEGSGYVYTPNELVRTLSRQKELNFKPGEIFSYSNSGYFLLSEIISRVSGMKTSAFAKKYIFSPLGMSNTHFHDDPNMIVKNRSYGYSPKKEGGFRLDILRLKVIGDLGVFTTIEDFLKWDQNFYDNKLGKGTKNLINMMLTQGKLNSGEVLPYAFGLNISLYGGLRTISHGGSAVGYQAQYMQFPDQRFSIVIMSNLGNFNTGRIARKIADLYLADQFLEPPTPRQRQRPQRDRPEPIRLSSSQLQKYAGNYYSDELDIKYILDVENNNLVLKLRETSSTLTPYSTESFGWGRRKLNFTRDREKRITGFVLQAGIVNNIKFQKLSKY